MKRLNNRINFWIVTFILVCLLSLCDFFAYSYNLDSAKIPFLRGDYKEAIKQGERLLASDIHSDELYYILGLSYLKDGNFLRASDIFEIILIEFKNSKFKEEAQLGLGNTYLLRNNPAKAQDCFQKLIKDDPKTKFKAQAYYGLSKAYFAQGNINQGTEYSNMLKKDFPLSLEASYNGDMCAIPSSSNVYYSVQVGAFSNSVNANNLVQRLLKKGYPAYVQELSSSGQASYRVRVGKLSLRQEVLELEQKLSQDGFPTKICP